MNRLYAAIIPMILCANASAQIIEGKGIYHQLMFGTSQDCPNAQNIHSFSPQTPTPLNGTYLNVGYIGEGVERTLQVANAVTWNLSEFTGLNHGQAPASFPAIQRGYRNEPAPVGTPGFQLSCGKAGLLINSYEFTHTTPIFGGGPFAGISKKLSTPAAVFQPNPPNTYGGGDFYPKLTIQGFYGTKFLIADADPTLTKGVAQAYLFYYAEPLTWNPANGPKPAIAQLVQLWDSRPFGSNNGYQFITSDGFTLYSSAPMRTFTADSQQVKYHTVSPFGSQSTNQDTFSGQRFYRFEVSNAQFAQMIADMKNPSMISCGPNQTCPPLSALAPADPKQWGVLQVGLHTEVSTGFGIGPPPSPQCVAGSNPPGCHNISIGANMQWVDVYKTMATGSIDY